MSNTRGRLIPLSAAGPGENMAVDQALLESSDTDGNSVLRFYCWSEPTLSLGYFQPFDDRQGHRPSQGLACVRRSTGGGAIVHDRELTYSLVMPLAAADSGPRLELYRRCHAAIVAALSDFGVRAASYRDTAKRPEPTDDPFLCFQRRTDEDLIVGGYKVLGSAQRKSRHAVLQHGSLLLHASSWAPELPGICDLTSTTVPSNALADCIAEKLHKVLSTNWECDTLTSSERVRSKAIERERFDDERWNRRR